MTALAVTCGILAAALVGYWLGRRASPSSRQRRVTAEQARMIEALREVVHDAEVELERQTDEGKEP